MKPLEFEKSLRVMKLTENLNTTTKNVTDFITVGHKKKAKSVGQQPYPSAVRVLDSNPGHQPYQSAVHVLDSKPSHQLADIRVPDSTHLDVHLHNARAVSNQSQK